jgi:hypothetical protein
MHMLIKLWSNNICNPQGKGLLPEQAFPMDKYKKPFYLNAGRFACKRWKGRPTWLLINQWDWLASHQPLLSGSNSNFFPTLPCGGRSWKAYYKKLHNMHVHSTFTKIYITQTTNNFAHPKMTGLKDATFLATL